MRLLEGQTVVMFVVILTLLETLEERCLGNALFRKGKCTDSKAEMNVLL